MDCFHFGHQIQPGFHVPSPSVDRVSLHSSGRMWTSESMAPSTTGKQQIGLCWRELEISCYQFLRHWSHFTPHLCLLLLMMLLHHTVEVGYVSYKLMGVSGASPTLVCFMKRYLYVLDILISAWTYLCMWHWCTHVHWLASLIPWFISNF